MIYRDDPTNVSLFGQSAGGISVIDLGAFPMYPPLSIKNGRYNNICLIMVNNEALELITRSVEQKCISAIIGYYNFHSCSSDRTVNNIRCCNIARLILMDKIFDCDIRQIFNYFYLKLK
jgi:hypothetical protein